MVDDDPAARNSVVALIQSHGAKAEGFASAEEFLTSFDGNRGGCLVLDVRMGGMSGLDLQKELVKRNASLPVIIITGHGDVQMAVQAMQTGAVTFLQKPVERDLWPSIEAALEKDRKHRHEHTTRAEVAQLRASLTAGEEQVLNLLLQGKPNKSIASALDVGLRTVEQRRANIMQKMHVESVAELVRQIMVLETPK